MAFRPAQIYTGTGWDDVGDPRLTSHTHAGGADGVNIDQSSVTGLSTSLSAKSDYELPSNVQSGTTYTFTLADARRLTRATSASAKTFSIPPQASVAWANDSIIRVVNLGAGALTVNGGSGVTVTNTATTLAQFQSAAAVRTGSNAWTLIPFGGGPSVPTSIEYLIHGGGGGGSGGVNNAFFGGGGAAGRRRFGTQTSIVPGTTYTVTVGGGGGRTFTSPAGSGGNSSVFSVTANGGAGHNNGSRTGGGNGDFSGGTDSSGLNNGGGAGSNGNGSGRTGGAAFTSSITGSAIARGGGGGGTDPGSGGGGGAGNGASGGGGSAVANRGSGGGGGGGASGGGNGSSGVVILKQLRSDSSNLAVTTGNPVVTNTATEIVYIFNASGSITWS